MTLKELLLSTFLFLPPADTTTFDSSNPSVDKTTARIGLVHNYINNGRDVFSGLGVKTRFGHQKILEDSTVVQGDISVIGGEDMYLRLHSSAGKINYDGMSKAGAQLEAHPDNTKLHGYIKQSYDLSETSSVAFKASLDMFDNPIGMYFASYNQEIGDLHVKPKIVLNSANHPYTVQAGVRIGFKDAIVGSLSVDDNNDWHWSVKLNYKIK